jgi:hypothetical protein
VIFRNRLGETDGLVIVLSGVVGLTTPLSELRLSLFYLSKVVTVVFIAFFRCDSLPNGSIGF